ncbi:hypothetical protein CUMW_045580 [Citrus unshiu]|nr:hypothetical protein CUMW_045580 [Citrus unshiu]
MHQSVYHPRSSLASNSLHSKCQAQESQCYPSSGSSMRAAAPSASANEGPILSSTVTIIRSSNGSDATNICSSFHTGLTVRTGEGLSAKPQKKTHQLVSRSKQQALFPLE